MCISSLKEPGSSGYARQARGCLQVSAIRRIIVILTILLIPAVPFCKGLTCRDLEINRLASSVQVNIFNIVDVDGESYEYFTNQRIYEFDASTNLTVYRIKYFSNQRYYWEDNIRYRYGPNSTLLEATSGYSYPGYYTRQVYDGITTRDIYVYDKLNRLVSATNKNKAQLVCSGIPDCYAVLTIRYEAKIGDESPEYRDYLDVNLSPILDLFRPNLILSTKDNAQHTVFTVSYLSNKILIDR